MQYRDLLEKAEGHKNKGEHDKAIEICQMILFSEPKHHHALEEIGDNYLSLREYEKSQKALERALNLNPLSANGNYLLGFVHSAVEAWKHSVRYLEKADEINPNHPEILRCLGWSIFHHGERIKGVAILKRALNLSPNDCLILSDLGICYLNEKKFDEACETFTIILKIEPNNDKAKECLRTAEFFKREYQKLNNM